MEGVSFRFTIYEMLELPHVFYSASSSFPGKSEKGDPSEFFACPGCRHFFFFYVFVSFVYCMETFYFFFVQFPHSITLRNKWSHQNLTWVHYLSFVNVHSRSNCPIIDHIIQCTLLSSTIQFCSSSTFISLRRRDSTFTRCCSENMVFCYCEGKTFIDRIRLNYPYLKVFFWTFKTQSRNSERSWLFKCFKGLQMIPGIPVYWVVQKINYLECPKKADKSFQQILHTRCLVCFNFCKRETNKHGDTRSSIRAN